MLVLEIHDGQGWREMSVAEDYAEELDELTAAPWHPAVSYTHLDVYKRQGILGT